MMKAKRKKLVIDCIVMLMVLCIAVSGCNRKASKDYSLVQIDENHYLVFDDIASYMPDGSGGNQCQAEPSLFFDSVKEFKNAVLKDGLSEEQKKTVAQFAKDDEGRIKVCDFNNLYSPVFPTQKANMIVVWAGATYAFMFGTEKNGHGTIILHTKDTFESTYQQNYVNFFDNELLTVTKIEQLDGGEKEVTYYETAMATLKRIAYTLTAGDKTFYIEKQYLLTHKYDLETSSTVPDDIRIYGVQDGQYYEIYMASWKEDPSDAWLLKLGLKKY